MNNLEHLTLAEMEEFVAGNDQVDWTVAKGEPLNPTLDGYPSDSKEALPSSEFH